MITGERGERFVVWRLGLRLAAKLEIVSIGKHRAKVVSAALGEWIGNEND